MKISSIAITAAIVAPALAAKTWDVNVVNGTFSPQVLDIAPGDTVVWPNNDGPDHAIVQTVSGAPSCNSLAGGFNSGRKTKGQAYQRTFPVATTINYKDGIGANCLHGAWGTIYVHTGARPSTEPSGTFAPTKTVSGTVSGTAAPTMTASGTASATAAPTKTAAPITKPNGASSLSAEKSLLLGVACFIGALAL